MNEHSKGLLQASGRRRTSFVRQQGTKPAQAKMRSSSGKSRRSSQPWESIRREKLSRARRLLQDAKYPSDEVIESVAKLLARNWKRLRNLTGSSAR